MLLGVHPLPSGRFSLHTYLALPYPRNALHLSMRVQRTHAIGIGIAYSGALHGLDLVLLDRR